MRRWTFNAIAALSLLLCMGIVGLWVESYNTRTFGTYRWSSRDASITSDTGMTAFGVSMVGSIPLFLLGGHTGGSLSVAGELSQTQ